MKGFFLDGRGDVVIEKNDIKMACETDHLIQKIRQILNTNRGEWLLDPKEGIPIRKILIKNPNLAMIRDYVRGAIAQADKSLRMTRCEIAREGRTLKITFDVAGMDGTVQQHSQVCALAAEMEV